MDQIHRGDTFDRIAGALTGLPDVSQTKPTTVTDVLPIAGSVTTYVVQTYKTRDQGFVCFVQIVDSEGRARFVLPSRVVEAIYRQRQRLTDRSTPASRKRAKAKRDRAKAREARTARRLRAVPERREGA